MSKYLPQVILSMLLSILRSAFAAHAKRCEHGKITVPIVFENVGSFSGLCNLSDEKILLSTRRAHLEDGGTPMLFTLL